MSGAGKVGIAFCVSELSYGKNFRIGDKASVFAAELVGILCALNFLSDFKPMRSVIFTDLLSSLSAMRNFTWNKCSPILVKILHLCTKLITQGIHI